MSSTDNEKKNTSAPQALQNAGGIAMDVLTRIGDFLFDLWAAIAAWVRRDLRPKNRLNVFSRYLFPVAFLWWEIVFKLSTTRSPGIMPIFYIPLFSLGWGLIFYLLTTNLKPRINRYWRIALLFLLCLPYITEYFVYRQFKVLYDLNTVTGGAGGVLTGFMGDVARLVFSVSGLFHILLFLLPFLLYVILLRHIDRARRIRMPRRIRTLAAIVVLFVFSWVLVHIPSSYRAVYKAEYNFQDAVGHFGLATGLRLELRQKFFGGRNVTFEAVEEETPAETVEEAPRVYGDNVLDIDFTALAASASDTNADLDTYVASLTPQKQNDFTGLFKGKNLIMITAEAFSGSMISKELTPTLYRLATKGINFTDYYLQATAGTTGGEYEHIFGMLPTEGGQSMKITEAYGNELTMGNMLSRFGYYGKAYHNNTYTYYDRDKTHINLGYSDGYMGYGNGMEQYVTKTWPESDLEMFQGTFQEYCDKQPFNVYYMTVSGHSEYSFEENKMAKKNQDLVAELPYSDRVKAYYACNLELEAGLTWLVQALEEKGIADDTVICITGDHFPYGLDDDAKLGNMPYLSELYGYEVTTYPERDLNRWILWSGSLEKDDPVTISAPTSTIDILPTLANLFGTEYDSRLFPGRDVFSDAEAIMFNLNYDWKTEKGTWINSTKTFTPANEGDTVTDEYIDRIKSIVRNKINYMTGFLKTDYFGHVFANYTFHTEQLTAGSSVPLETETYYETDELGETMTDEAGQPVLATDAEGNPATRNVGGVTDPTAEGEVSPEAEGGTESSSAAEGG